MWCINSRICTCSKWLPAEQYFCEMIRLRRLQIRWSVKTIRLYRLPSTALMTANGIGGILSKDVPGSVAMPATLGTGVALLFTEGDIVRRVVDSLSRIGL